MKERELSGLSFRIWTNQCEDVSVIFADPTTRDLETIIPDLRISRLITQLLFDPDRGRTACFTDSTDFIVNFLRHGRSCIGGDALNGTNDPDIKEEDIKIEDELCEVSRKEEEMVSHAKRKSKRSGKDRVLDTANRDEEDLSGLKKTEEEYTVKPDKLIWPYKKISDSEYQCEVCTKILSNSSNVKKHIQTHGINLEPLEDRTCPHCQRVFDYALLCRKHHIQRVCEFAKVPECDHCGSEFENGAALKEHIRAVHNIDKLKCSFCDWVGSTVDHRKVHEKRLHLNLYCAECKKYFQSESEKEDHSCSPERHHCDQCDKNYRNRADLRIHVMKVHRGERPSYEREYPCHVCGAILSSKRSLHRHMSTVHETEKNVRCDMCGKAFKTKADLRGHMKTHDETKSDPCPECGKRLSSNDHLRTHIRVVHKKMEFKHVCYECGKSFPYANLLNIHRETRHSAGEFVVCNICGKNIRGELKLSAHISKCHPEGQSTSPCQFCSKEIPNRQMQTHVVEAHKMQEYRFQCDQCPKRFNKRADIRNHYRKHTGCRPFVCRGCGEFHVSLSRMRAHINKSHHGDLSLSLYDKQRDTDNPWVEA